jgi:hypothetical protein
VALAVAGVCSFGVAGKSSAATLITAWNFDNLPVAFNTSPAASTGTGVAAALGMTNSYNGTTSVSTPDVLSDAGSSTGGPNAWRVRGQMPGNGWSSQAPIGSQGAEFDASTVGYSGITVSFDLHTTAQSEANLELQYTTNGSTWNNAALTYGGAGATVKTNTTSVNTVMGSYIQFTDTSAPWYNNITAVLTGVPAAGNNSKFGIRLVNASTGVDDVNQGGTAYNNSSGNWRYDNVVISGVVTPVPAPTMLRTMLSFIGVGALGLLAQRRKA